jgi:hypothetical protein
MHRKVTTGKRNHSGLLRVRIKGIPALRYEGFDLSLYEVGSAYHVERRLADLLIDRGFAELERPQPRNSKVKRDSAF